MIKMGEWKLRIILLTSVSSIVMLGGCDSYTSLKRSLSGEREPQHVDGGRRMPVMNPQGMQQAQPMMMPQQQMPAPQAMPPQVMQAPQLMQPQPAPRMGKLVTADDAHFVSNNNMNPPATGANEMPGDGDASQYAQRKPIERNPYADNGTQMVAPVPEGPLLDDAPKSNVMMRDTRQQASASEPVPVPLYKDDVPTQPLAQPMMSAPAAKESPFQEPNLRVDDHSMTNKVMLDDEPQQPLLSAPAATVPVAPVVPPAPQGDIPLVEAMPLDPDEARVVPQPLRAPAPIAPLAPQSSVQDDAAAEAPAPKPVQIAAVEDEETVPPVIPQAPADTHVHADASAADDDMFIPVTDFKTNDDTETVTISSLADKQKQQQQEEASSSWFDEVFGESKEEKTGDKRTWIERQLGFKDAKPEAQQEPYPEFSSVPEKPKQLETAQQASQQNLQQLQTMHEQAQESQNMLDSEPSTMMDMQQTQQRVEEAARTAAPAAPVSSQPQLLGQMSAPPELHVVADETTDTNVVQEVMPQTAKTAVPVARAMEVMPASVTPLVAPMNVDGGATQAQPVAAPATDAKAQADASVARAQQALDDATANLDAAQDETEKAVEQGGVVFPDATKARQDEVAAAQQAIEEQAMQQAAPAATAPAVAMPAALPSPALLDQVQVLPPSRYESRRQQ